MTPYAPPIEDMRFALNEIAGLSEIAALPGFEAAEPALVDQILEEAGRFASGVLAPLNQGGDREGSVLENGVVRTPKGFAEAYRGFVAGGWNSVPFEPEHGGQGLPWMVQTALAEMWSSANMSFSLCPMLNGGALDLLVHHGSEEQKRLYLAKLVSGEWTGTMNLTEPQAGTDLGALRTKAVPDGNAYRITGQKIFITYGGHAMAEDVVHMVLARTPDAPPGTRGISLFIVPKFLVNGDGSLGRRNDVRCVSLEHKLGIHASPTCVLAYGDDGGALGTLVGGENRGIECMFTMMNNERIGVGIQGLGVAERAYQQAREFARVRVQSRAIEGSPGPVPIIRHPDVRRMLISMKSQTEAMRGLAYQTASWLDRARRDPDRALRARSQTLVDLLVPVVKAWCSDTAVEIASTGIQVHGGMGFIEETGAAQHLRDARITPIYEGTNGIQANDLVGRKVVRDGGEAARLFLAEVERAAETIDRQRDEGLAPVGQSLSAGATALAEATDWLVATYPGDVRTAAVGAVPYLRLFGIVAGGWAMARAATAAKRQLAGANGASGFLKGKLTTARFYADHVLSQAPALVRQVTGGSAALDLAEEQF
ncbi:MAG: acyl-CoA dehydrogenase [Proteobacteria bacterium]|nr:acyl-CoA dehydrogenase [Pseudomonadota bacterium]